MLFKSYKLSKYNSIIDSIYGTLLYNQISGALMLLSEKELKQYEKKSFGFIFKKMLIKCGFLIEKDFDEVYWMHDIALKKAKSSLTKVLTIAPTDKCNLNCPYCYETKHHWTNMEEETIRQCKRFIEVFINDTPTNNFHITWFGGEPTLHMDCIEQISKHVNIVKNKNTIFTQNMITNGTLLNEKNRKKLKELGIKNLQITVDGIKEEHDKKRPYRTAKNIELKIIQSSSGGCSSGGCSSGGCSSEGCSSGGCSSNDDKHAKSSYDKIMSYIPLLYDEGFKISLRVNLNQENIYSYDKLKDSLKHFSKPNEEGGQITPYPARIHDFLNLATQEDISKIDSKIFPLKPFSGESCMANQTYSFGISQNGFLSKCWDFITNESHNVGHISDLEKAKIGYFDDWSPVKDEECSKCSVLPTCWGGCRYLNQYWDKENNKEKKYNGIKYEGCDKTRWNLKNKIIELYEAQQ